MILKEQNSKVPTADTKNPNKLVKEKKDNSFMKEEAVKVKPRELSDLELEDKKYNKLNKLEVNHQK